MTDRKMAQHFFCVWILNVLNVHHTWAWSRIRMKWPYFSLRESTSVSCLNENNVFTQESRSCATLFTEELQGFLDSVHVTQVAYPACFWTVGANPHGHRKNTQTPRRTALAGIRAPRTFSLRGHGAARRGTAPHADEQIDFTGSQIKTAPRVVWIRSTLVQINTTNERLGVPWFMTLCSCTPH